MKDACGTGSQNIWYIPSFKSFIKALKEAKKEKLLGSFITLEPYFFGTLYSAEMLSWKGQHKLLAISSRILSAEPLFKEEAIALPVNLDSIFTNKIYNWICKVLNVTEYYDGFSHIEFMILKDGNLEIIEINPRLGGMLIGECLNNIFAYNCYTAFIDMALGKRPALLDKSLVSTKGMAMACIYAPKIGKFSHVQGLEKLNFCTGEIKYFPTADFGKNINTLKDQRSCLGILLSYGDTSKLRY